MTAIMPGRAVALQVDQERADLGFQSTETFILYAILKQLQELNVKINSLPGELALARELLPEKKSRKEK